MTGIQAELLHRPESPELRFLPEGPMPLGDGISWVAIQHGADGDRGSLNTLDAAGNAVADHVQ